MHSLVHGDIMHKRLLPKANCFKYQSTYIAFSLKEKVRLKNPLFGVNTPNLFAFFDRDHGNGSNDCLAWIENILQQTNNLNGLNLNNYEIYTDSHKLINNNNNNNNVNKNGSQRIVNSNGSKQNNINGNHDRPMLPPPPIPNNQISDLQQIQQQMIKKKLTKKITKI